MLEPIISIVALFASVAAAALFIWNLGQKVERKKNQIHFTEQNLDSKIDLVEERLKGRIKLLREEIERELQAISGRLDQAETKRLDRTTDQGKLLIELQRLIATGAAQPRLPKPRLKRDESDAD
jgi:CHASE1-domain containing sensor protein